jgi:hypothetical protein
VYEETSILAQEFQELKVKYEEELRGKVRFKQVMAEYEKTIAALIDGLVTLIHSSPPFPSLWNGN